MSYWGSYCPFFEIAELVLTFNYEKDFMQLNFSSLGF